MSDAEHWRWNGICRDAADELTRAAAIDGTRRRLIRRPNRRNPTSAVHSIQIDVTYLCLSGPQARASIRRWADYDDDDLALPQSPHAAVYYILRYFYCAIKLIGFFICCSRKRLKLRQQATFIAVVVCCCCLLLYVVVCCCLLLLLLLFVVVMLLLVCCLLFVAAAVVVVTWSSSSYALFCHYIFIIYADAFVHVASYDAWRMMFIMLMLLINRRIHVYALAAPALAVAAAAAAPAPAPAPASCCFCCQCSCLNDVNDQKSIGRWSPTKCFPLFSLGAMHLECRSFISPAIHLLGCRSIQHPLPDRNVFNRNEMLKFRLPFRSIQHPEISRWQQLSIKI